jgi:adenylate cyclase
MENALVSAFMDGTDAPRTGDTEAPRAHRTYSLQLTLAVSFGLLTIIAVAAVLVIALGSGQRNTRELNIQLLTQSLAQAVEGVERHLAPARAQVEFVAGAIESGKVGLDNEETFKRFLEASLAAAPQVASIVFVDPELHFVGALRTPGGTEAVSRSFAGNEGMRKAVEGNSKRYGAYWGPPVRARASGRTILNLRRAVRHGDRYLGMIVAVVTISELSDHLREAQAVPGATPFVLYGHDQVLAHPKLTADYPGLSSERPLPLLADFPDKGLAAMWRPELRREMSIELKPPYRNHSVRVGGNVELFFYQEVGGYGDKPWTIGLHVPFATIEPQVSRLVWAGAAGLAALVLSLLAALAIGRMVSRPVTRLANAASSVAALKLNDVPALGKSRIRELDSQAAAFNTMLRGLRWFETYVPKRLVERLVETDAGGPLHSVERDLTIMFTDISGFTALSEGASAADVATLLNHHFALVAACIEEEGGTVDKFIGDSVMAFWGAPDKQKNRAVRACEAARAIARAIKQDNAERKEVGLAPIRVRVGIHSGRVTVGNIGAPGRINYTIVGDPVNVAARLEQQAREFAPPDAEVTVLISGDTRAHLGEAFDLERVGEVTVRGRKAPVELFRMAQP